MSKYFGTDGIRGVYGENLTDDLAYRAGLATGAVAGGGLYIIGCDTRPSCPALLKAYSDGLINTGCDVLYAGILPTPAVSYLTIKYGAKRGVMISASHNPPEYNGIKIFNGQGIKLTEDEEAAVESRIDNLPKVSRKGRYKQSAEAAGEYSAHIVSLFGDCDFKGIKVALDCANGASGTVAPGIFRDLGFKAGAINFGADKGALINAGCGALYPEAVMSCMKDEAFGLSFDGDADRLSIALNQKNKDNPAANSPACAALDGDSVIYNLSKSMPLKDNTVVGTILNNLALEQALNRDGIKFVRTPVGDKYIADEMLRKGYSLGGEQSGHYIIKQCGATGDGIAASLFFIKSLLNGGKIREPYKLELCPQGAISEYAKPSILEDAGFKALVKKYAEELKGTGRIITRMSGTEPKVRVMAECKNAETVKNLLSAFKTYIQSIQ